MTRYRRESRLSPTRTIWIILAYAAMCLIWGSTWIMIKVGVTGAPPLTVLAVRFVLATVIVGIVVRALGLRVPRTREFLILSVFLGVVHQAAGYIFVYWAEQHISSALTAVLFSTMPFAVALLARAIIGDPLTPRKLIGALAGTVGVVMVYADSLGAGATMAAAGVASVLAAVFAASLSSVVVKKYARDYHPLVMLLYPILVGGIVVSALAVPIESSNPMTYNRATWGSIVYLAVIGSAGGFTLFYWVVKRVDVTVVSYQTFIIPIIAVILGRIFLGETLSGKVGIGAAFILAGIAVATIGSGRKKAEQ